MTQEEEHQALDAMWLKIQDWIKGQPRFSATMGFGFPHDVYHWTKFEVYTDGSCAILRGSHGNPGESRPQIIRGLEMFEFGSGDGGLSWHGDLSILDLIRNGLKGSGVYWWPDYHDRLYGRTLNYAYSLLRELYENWAYVKRQIEAAIEADRKLENFDV